MLTIKKQPKKSITGDTAYDFDFSKYHDDAISDIVNRFKKTGRKNKPKYTFESDFVFRESDAKNIIEACSKMNLPFEVSYKLVYDGCWEINFKTLLEKEMEAC